MFKEPTQRFIRVYIGQSVKLMVPKREIWGLYRGCLGEKGKEHGKLQFRV